jgi:anti-anti-sigma regulatory factor
VAGPSGPATVDLGPIEFFDSSALRMLQQVSAEIDRAGGRPTVAVAPGSIVDRLFTMMHMDAYLHLGRPHPQV